MKYIFIDIDGVLNPNVLLEDFRVIPKKEGLPEYLEERYPIFLKNEQGQWLNSLSARTGAKLIWGTSWKNYANEAVGSKIGLPHMPYMPIRREKEGESYGLVKAQAVQRYTRGSKFVYFDDKADLGSFFRGMNGLHIYTDPRIGITVSHIKVAEKFLNN